MELVSVFGRPCRCRPAGLAFTRSVHASTPLLWIAAIAIILAAPRLWAQAPPGGSALHDTPSVRVDGTIFADYTYFQSPETLDADGNRIHPSAFNITRAYVNARAVISRMVSARITSDVTADTNSADTALNGSQVIRLKYAYGQINFDEWAGREAWLRLGLQQTPWLQYNEDIYRYRFQGPMFSNVEGFLTASDYGASVHYAFPSSYGDLHLGWYNGEGYTSLADNLGRNNQKGFQIRGSIRPAPRVDVLSGLRVNVFYDGDHYVQDAAKERFIANITFENPHVNFSAEYLQAKDRLLSGLPEATAEGYSVWATPRTSIGIEALLRYDSLKPRKDVDARKKRFIGGISYWFPVTTGGIATALLADYTEVKFDRAFARPGSRAWALHTLFQF